MEISKLRLNKIIKKQICAEFGVRLELFTISTEQLKEVCNLDGFMFTSGSFTFTYF